ncbi:MAG TPA: hypothetical protein VMS89_06500 [Methanoregulaceae archaeon]|nr:hypothetical protein [Methanoregulaceae archaeon]
MYMGDYIGIEQETGPFEFDCVSVSTGTPFHARVDEDKRTLFLERDWIERHPRACRFLRPAGDSRIVCTIHDTSAVQCKFYRCTVLKIFSPEGTFLGKVTGNLSLHTEDGSLKKTWESADREIPWNSPDVEEWIAMFLRNKGYIVE